MSSTSPIDPREIDVVIQGAIAGKPTDPARLRLTAQCLGSLRTYLPGARLILSTWEGADVAGLDFDELVVSKDPGAQNLRKRYRRVPPLNLNRQLVSTQAGLAITERPYALKFRTDMTLSHANFLTYWNRHPKRCPQWKIFEDRILVGSNFTTSPYRFGRQAFGISDWASFGRREDVQRLWSAPPFPDEYMHYFFDNNEKVHPFYRAPMRYSAEQYIWLSALRTHSRIPFRHQWDFNMGNAPIHNLTLANNMMVLDNWRFGLRFRKYGLGLINKLNMYSYAEWCGLYQQFCDPTSHQPTTPLRTAAKQALAEFIYHRPTLCKLVNKLDYQYTKRSAWLGKRGWW